MDQEEMEWTMDKGEKNKEKPEFMMEKKEKEGEEEWTMDKLLGFGRFHYFQIWVVQALVAVLGMQEALYVLVLYFLRCSIVFVAAIIF
jgi:hypothetical protein